MAIGHYIVDFLCVEKKVIVEIDGNAHYKKGAWNYDQKRDDYLRSEGFLVVRCNHREVIDYTNKVLNRILGYLE